MKHDEHKARIGECASKAGKALFAVEEAIGPVGNEARASVFELRLKLARIAEQLDGTNGCDTCTPETGGAP